MIERRSRLMATALAYAASAGVLTGLLGGAITSLIWIVQTPSGARRAVYWGMMHGVLIGAAGLVTGVVAGLGGMMLGETSARRRTGILGALVGAVVGGALAGVLWGEASGKPVAIAAIAAHIVVGAAVALLARRSARTRVLPA